MTTLTLLVKALHNAQLKQVDELLRSQFEDLGVEVEVLGSTVNRWVQVSLSGEDEAIATNYIKKEIGTCPITLADVQESAVLKGYISKVDMEQLRVDIGVLEPKGTQATIPTATLQAQLANGKEMPLKKIAETYGLVEGLPLTVKIMPSSGEELQAELSATQLERLEGWQQSLLDRLIVLGAAKETLESVLERTRLDRDVIDVETLGFFEHALTCKFGTDARGLISRLGRYLRNSVFVVFDADKIRSFLGEQGLTL